MLSPTILKDKNALRATRYYPLSPTIYTISKGVCRPHSSLPTQEIHSPPPSSSSSSSSSMEITSTEAQTQENSIKETKPRIQNDDIEGQNMASLEVEVVDYSKRAQWLRAAVLGANDGLLSTAALMMGVGAVRHDAKTMILTGIAGTVGGACSMAIGEFVSVYSQYDIEMAEIRREGLGREVSESELEGKRKKLPSPFVAAMASAAAFAVGAAVPLLAAGFVKEYKVRLGVVIGAVSFALLGFGALSAVLGRAPLVKSSLRVLVGGWLAMAITFGLTKLVGSTGL